MEVQLRCGEAQLVSGDERLRGHLDRVQFTVEVRLPKIEELHSLIFATLIDLPRPLKGAEVCFVRKYIKIPSQLFAQVLGIDQAHLSRFENGKTKSLGKSTERLARLLVKGIDSKEHLHAFLTEMFTKVVKKVRERPATPTFTLVKNTWKVAA